MNPEILSVEDVEEIHEAQIARYGGSAGLRDRALLESAVAMPQAAFGGESLHGDLFAMAAAYLYYLVKSHAFVDGNKRIGLAAALVFLDLNGRPIVHSTSRLAAATLDVASGHLTKDEGCRPAPLPRVRPVLIGGGRPPCAGRRQGERRRHGLSRPVIRLLTDDACTVDWTLLPKPGRFPGTRGARLCRMAQRTFHAGT